MTSPRERSRHKTVRTAIDRYVSFSFAWRKEQNNNIPNSFSFSASIQHCQNFFVHVGSSLPTGRTLIDCSVSILNPDLPVQDRVRSEYEITVKHL